ncbi:MAG: antirestriction protein ArdA [Frankiaceae bacterium]
MSDPEQPEQAIETQDAPRPRIWVAPLAEPPRGRWLEAARDPDELQDDITWMLLGSADPRNEEWSIGDYEGFGPLRLSSREDLAAVSRLARGILTHGPAFATWAALAGTERAQSDEFTDAYLGEWDSVTAYAEQLADDLGYTALLDAALPPHLKPYVCFDAAAYGRDLVREGALAALPTPTGRVWLFSLTLGARGP